MATSFEPAGIDPASWKATILALPKRFSRGAALGFSDGQPVGRSETARARSLACWWPGGQAELLELEGCKDVQAGRAGDTTIPGQWIGKDGAMGAAAWRHVEGRLAGVDLHDPAYERTWATASGGGLVVGMGTPRRVPGIRPLDVGLVWRDGAKSYVVVADAAHGVGLHATNGSALAGSLDGRAAWWPTPDASPVDLAPAGMAGSEVTGLDDGLQVGIAWKGMCARAALWRGDAASFVDLTPGGFQTARANAGVRGWQVGYVRAKDTTRNGSTAYDNRAVLWQGAPDRWLDLNALLPAGKYNASAAWAITVVGDELRICGEASRFEARDPDTARESHVVPVAHPVLWTARLAG